MTDETRAHSVGFLNCRLNYRLLSKLEDAVHFAGLMDAEQVVEQVARHDLFVLPSFQEGMPRAMLEAMATGTPVVASNVGGIPEVLMEDSMVEPGDSEALVARIEALANNKALLAERSRVHRQAAAAFSFSALRVRHRAYCAALVEAHRNA
jgi:glycosyltransferase involved in cell wall biosynthesis